MAYKKNQGNPWFYLIRFYYFQSSFIKLWMFFLRLFVPLSSITNPVKRGTNTSPSAAWLGSLFLLIFTIFPWSSSHTARSPSNLSIVYFKNISSYGLHIWHGLYPLFSASVFDESFIWFSKFGKPEQVLMWKTLLFLLPI